MSHAFFLPLPHLGVQTTKPFSGIGKNFRKIENGKLQCCKSDCQTRLNATRMIAHWKAIHGKEEQDDEVGPVEKKSNIGDHFDRNLTPGQLEKAGKWVVFFFAVITNGRNYNIVQNSCFQTLCHTLCVFWRKIL